MGPGFSIWLEWLENHLSEARAVEGAQKSFVESGKRADLPADFSCVRKQQATVPTVVIIGVRVTGSTSMSWTVCQALLQALYINWLRDAPNHSCGVILFHPIFTGKES